MKRRLRISLALLLLFLALDYALYPRFSTRAPKFQFSRNAIWLHFDWAQGKSRESLKDLGARLQENGINDVYFHVRYIGKSGALRFRDAAQLRRLNLDCHQAAPHLRRYAWIYIGNARGITGVDISDPKIRRRIVAECQFLTRDCGFDGVQIDYEICSDGDADFLQLLREVRAATPQKWLCVATPMWLPSPLGAYGWSENYFRQIAQNCDQIAVMAYDSALYFPRHYVWLVKQQAVRIPRAVAASGANCQVVIGVPSYEDGGPSHWPYAENLALALRGVREGASSANGEVLQGVALFADYTTDQREWAIWRENLEN